MTVETSTTLLPVLDASTGRPVAPPPHPSRLEPYRLGGFVACGHAVAVYRNGAHRLWLDISLGRSDSWQGLGAVVWRFGVGPELHMHPIWHGGVLVLAPGTPAAEVLLRRAVEVALA